MTVAAMEGRRILVVEDEMLLAMDIEATLNALGCVVVGPTGKLETAMKLADVETLDAAVLDVTIRGGVFENTGFKVGAFSVYDPQTGHYLA